MHLYLRVGIVYFGPVRANIKNSEEEPMKLKRMLAIILCAAILSCATYGCKTDTEDASPLDPPSENGNPSDGAVADNYRQSVDFDAAFSAFAPDTVMIVAGEFEVTWAKLFFLLCSSISSMISAFGAFPDLSLTVSDGITYAEALLDSAVEYALHYLALEYGAMVLGVTLNEEELEMLNANYEDLVEMYGGEEPLCELIWRNSGIYDLELFLHLLYLNYLPLSILYSMFGQDGELVSDEDVSEFAADEGYLMAKHILRMKTEDNDEAPRVEIEDVLLRLNNYDGDDLEGFFDELMFEYSEDSGGLSMFPDGYLFQLGDMQESFCEAAAALEIGAYSGIVETENSYDIILRLPLDYDAVPIASLIVGDDTPLRIITAVYLFDMAIAEWRDSLLPVFTAEFESIDIETLFVLRED